MKGIIISNVSNIYQVKTVEKTYETQARGKLKQLGIKPVVGDKVKIKEIENEKGKAIIENIYPRTTCMKRPKIANISQVVFVVSTKDPIPDLLMLDKQLAYAEFLNIKPLIIINKIDLTEDYQEIYERYMKIGYKVLLVSAKEKCGIEEIKESLKNHISAFSGISGVGKSSILNELFGEIKTESGEISKKNKKGKNTTTEVQLYELDENTFIADTPGFSSFELKEIPSKELYQYFIEFTRHIKDCKYMDCTHIKEEDCGIKRAFQRAEISKERYNNFCKIYQEIKQKEERKW